MRPQASVKSLLLGGILPVLVFTLVEEIYGTLWGLIVGMIFGVGEILHERIRYGKVDGITWFGNGILLVLGGVSLATQEGIWFKLQPALIEVGMGALLIGSWIVGKPFLGLMARKQKTLDQLPPSVRERFGQALSGLTLRLAIFFWLHAALATYAALYWSTRAWALLKGVGFTVSMLLYMLVEILVLRAQVRRAHENPV